MEDIELVLRFFALRHVEHYRNGMQGFLDIYMRKSLDFTEADIEVLEKLFSEALDLASAVYGDLLFRPFDREAGCWQERAQKAYYDAVMVGFASFLDRSQKIRAKAKQITEATAVMFTKHDEGTFTGRGNTKDDVQTRIRYFKEMIEGAIA